MIKNTDAVQAAKKYAAELFSDASVVRLEEIELDEMNKTWLVTVSLRRSLPAMGYNPFGEDQLDLKVVRVDAQTGEVVSVKNRAA